MKIRITPEVALDEKEIQEQFVRSSGPGGQNVNKVSTAVELRLDVRNSPSIPPEVRQRLRSLAGKKMTDEGVLIISAARFRTQERNRLDAMSRLVDVIRRAAQRPKRRKKTAPTAASKTRRLEGKKRRSVTKSIRRPVGEELN